MNNFQSGNRDGFFEKLYKSKVGSKVGKNIELHTDIGTHYHTTYHLPILLHEVYIFGHKFDYT